MSIRKIRAAGIILLLCVSLAWTGVAVLPQAGYPPRANPYVNDYADVISDEDEATLRSMLRSLRTEAGIDAVVLTIESIDDYGTGDTSIEAFATSLFNTWAIDDAETNDGVLIVVAVEDRNVRIELGRAYGQRYNSAMQDVIDDHMLPYFREEQFSEGIVEGTDATIQVVTGEALAPASPLGRVQRWFGSLADRIRNNRFIAGVLVLFGTAAALWRRFLYYARGGCLREIKSLITTGVTGAVVGGFIGSIVGMIAVDFNAPEQTMMQVFDLFESGQYRQEFTLLSVPLWLGAGLGAVVNVVLRLIQGSDEYRRRYGGGSGGGSSGGGGASGSW